MTFVCCCFNVKWIALFVYREYLKRTLLCRSGNSEGLLLSHHFTIFFFFWNWQNKFSPMPSGKAVVLPPSHAYLCHRYHDYPRLRLSSILVYSWCLVQCLTHRYVLSKCEHLLDQSLKYSLVWKKWVRGHDFAH